MSCCYIGFPCTCSRRISSLRSRQMVQNHQQILQKQQQGTNHQLLHPLQRTMRR